MKMRILILFITFILLTFPLFGGHHTEFKRYKWITVSGVVWKGFGDKDVNPQYVGEIDQGIPNGVGILVYIDGSKYVGEFKNGVEHGYGTMFFTPSDKVWDAKFVGQWKEGKKWNGWIYDNWDKELKKYANGKVVVDLSKSK